MDNCEILLARAKLMMELHTNKNARIFARCVSYELNRKKETIQKLNQFVETALDAAEYGGDWPGDEIFEAAISIGAIEAHSFDENEHENLEDAENLEPGDIVYLRKRLK